MRAIRSFEGAFLFLSNFFPSPVVLAGKRYPSAEHAYQALKAVNERDQEYVRAAPTADEAKRRGRSIERRPDWIDVRSNLMERVLRAKFQQHPDLLRRLCSTGGALLVEDNTWGDSFWGVVDGNGQNRLGVLLMKIRAEFADSSLLAPGAGEPSSDLP